MNGVGYRKKMLWLPLTTSRRFCLVPVLMLAVIFLNLHASYGQGQLVLFEQNKKWGYMNENGRVVIEPQFIIAHDFSPEGIAAVVDGEHSMRTGGKWGYIDKKGQIVIPLAFENASNFENGQARVELNGESLYIDKNEKIIK